MFRSRFHLTAILVMIVAGLIIVASCDATSSSTPPGRFTQDGTFTTTQGNNVQAICDHATGNLIYVHGYAMAVVAGGCSRGN